MNPPKTLIDLAGRPRPTIDWSKAAVLLIDHQREYVDGKLPLSGMPAAIAAAAELLALARERGAPVIHIQHLLPAGAPVFDSAGPFAAFIDKIAPQQGEAVVAKTKPSAFAGTDLEERLRALGVGQLVIAGFMTHVCVSTTTRAAAERGYPVWVVADACATRPLPLPGAEPVAAESIHRATLAALNDAFATVVSSTAALR